MRYFYVKDDIIDRGPVTLPIAWRNISGLNHATPDELKAFGWLPETIVGFEPFDPATQVRTGPVNQINDIDVTATYTVRMKTADELMIEQNRTDLMDLQTNAGKDALIVLVELIEWLLANTDLTSDDFSDEAKATYEGLKPIAERVRDYVEPEEESDPIVEVTEDEEEDEEEEPIEEEMVVEEEDA